MERNLRRSIDIAVAAALGLWALYMLALGKAFSPSVPPAYYRDLGILWDNADDILRQHRYGGDDYFPPSTYIFAHLLGLGERGVAFRAYLLMQVLAMAIGGWAWSRFSGLWNRKDRALGIAAAVLAASFFIRFQLGIHNVNAEAFALVSLALLWSSRPQASAASYALSLAIKPYSSVLLLPWMVWRRRWVWVALVLAWLMVFFVLMPAAWFGPTTALDLTRQWLGRLFAATDTNEPPLLSVRAGVAALMGLAESSEAAHKLAVALQLAWLLALAVFFVPTLRRQGLAKGPAAACEAAALLLVGLPLGTHQQVARFIALLPSTLIMASAMVDAGRSTTARLSLAVILTTIGVASWVTPVSPVFYLLTLVFCLLALGGLAIARHSGWHGKEGSTAAGETADPDFRGTPTPYQASIQRNRFSARGVDGGRLFSAPTSHRRVSAGSMTSSTK